MNDFSPSLNLLLFTATGIRCLNWPRAQYTHARTPQEERWDLRMLERLSHIYTKWSGNMNDYWTYSLVWSYENTYMVSLYYNMHVRSYDLFSRPIYFIPALIKHVACPLHRIPPNGPDNIWWGVTFMKLLIRCSNSVNVLVSSFLLGWSNWITRENKTKS
jgi:hypothetical protein